MPHSGDLNIPTTDYLESFGASTCGAPSGCCSHAGRVHTVDGSNFLASRWVLDAFQVLLLAGPHLINGCYKHKNTQTFMVSCCHFAHIDIVFVRVSVHMYVRVCEVIFLIRGLEEADTALGEPC